MNRGKDNPDGAIITKDLKNSQKSAKSTEIAFFIAKCLSIKHFFISFAL